MDRITRPATVAASFWLWIVTVVLSAISIITSLVNGSYDVADVGGNAQVAAAVGPATAIIGLAAGAALRILFAVYMLRGRNWARIVLLILAIIAVLAGLPAFATGNIVDILIVVVALTAAVLMYLPASNPYFRRRTAAA
jgi:predicted anti-sigma-YlaC factor YlaD